MGKSGPYSGHIKVVIIAKMVDYRHLDLVIQDYKGRFRFKIILNVQDVRVELLFGQIKHFPFFQPAF